MDLHTYLSTRTRKNYTTDCIEWTLKPTAWGYARINRKSRLYKKYRQQFLHRIVWMEANRASIPEGFLIMHLCDNPKCLNIKHLLLGTVQDNNRDRTLKGRTKNVHGINSPHAKLDNTKVKLLRKLKGEYTAWFLKDFFSVSPACISALWEGRTWKHVK